MKTYQCYEIGLTGMTWYVYYLNGTEACKVSMLFLFGDHKVGINASGKHWDCIVGDVTLFPDIIRKIESNDAPRAGFDILYGGFDRSELILKGYSSIEIRCEENRYCFFRQNVLLAESVPAGEDDT